MSDVEDESWTPRKELSVRRHRSSSPDSSDEDTHVKKQLKRKLFQIIFSYIYLMMIIILPVDKSA